MRAGVPVARDFAQSIQNLFRNLLLALVVCSGPAVVAQPTERPKPTKTELAPGVFLFQSQPYGDAGLDGNAVVVVSKDGVLVFDSNGTPDAARAVIGEIRKVTDQHVKYVVNSHWHWDHWYGTEAYKAAFPGVRVIMQEKMRELADGPAQAFNRPFLERDLPGYVESLARKVKEEEAQNPPPTGLSRLRELYRSDAFFLEQKRNARLVLADETFSDRMTIYLGGRQIELLHYGRAVTPGDTMIYLPEEKILLVGDLIVNPVTFALGCYPSEWLAALEKVDQLDFKILVTGHGAALYDRELMHATMDVMRVLLRREKELKTQGMDADQAKAEILPELASLRAKITGDDATLNQQFEIYLVDWYLHRVYDELNGPLTDAIQPPPAH